MTQRNRPLRVLRRRSRSAIGPSARFHLTPKPSAAAVAVALVALGGAGLRHAVAAPTDGVVSAGNATILQSGAVTTINQTSSRAAIDWRTFGINANESVIFQQPSSSAVALNRVAAGAGRSEIYGSLQANGHVFLINPAGVLFARGATVDVAGLVASTLNITNNDFMAGRLVFSGGAGSGSVTNEIDSRVKDGGYLRAKDGGYVAFLGNQVSNAGTISAPNGTVALGAGESMVLDFHGDGLLSLKVNAAAAKARIDNTGEIHAEGGAVIMSARAKDALLDTVLNVEGIVTAKGLVERGGYIYLDGGTSGVTSVSGTLDASSAQAKGGEIRVLGEDVGLFGNAKVDASGATGGGTVLVGGDFQGKNAEVANASRTYVGPDATIKADATTSGDGGKVIVWADGATQYLGNISAHGGAQGGDGGFAEVSGKGVLDFRGNVDLRAARGHTGTLLLDPVDLNVIDGLAGGSTEVVSTPGNPFTFTSAGTSTITDGAINAQLGNASVIVQTGAGTGGNGDITFPGGSPIVFDAGGTANNLTFLAHRNIAVNQSTSYTNGTGLLSLTAGAFGTVTVAAPLSTSGPITLTANDVQLGGPVSAPGQIVTIKPLTALRPINLGTETASLSLTNAELNNVTAGTLRIGAKNGVFGSTIDAGAISVSQQITLDAAKVTNLHLLSGPGVASGFLQPGGIAVSGLAITAGGAVRMFSNDSYDRLAVSTPADAAFRDVDGGLEIAAVDGVSGISAAGSFVLLNGNLTQSAPIVAGRFGAYSASSIDLTHAGNQVDRLQLQADGASASFRSTSGFTVDRVTATNIGTSIVSMYAGSSVRLESGGAITQIIPINTGTLAVKAGGAVDLDVPGVNNGVVTVAINAPGQTVEFRNNGNLTIGALADPDGAGPLTAITGITGSSANVTAAGSLTIGSDVSTGTGSVNLASTAGTGIIGGAGRVSSTGTVTLSGAGIGTAAAPVLLDLGTVGTVNATSSGAGAEGEIALSDNAAGGLSTSRVTVTTAAGTAEQITLAQSGAGGLTVNTAFGNGVDDIALVADGSISVAANVNGGAVVSLQSGGSITVSANVTKGGSGDGSLTLRANDNIVFNSSADVGLAAGASGKLAVVLNADRDGNNAGAIQINSGTVIDSNGSNITLGGGSAPESTAAFGAGSFLHGVDIDGAQLTSGAGNISIHGIGNSGNVSAQNGVRITGSVQSTSGTIGIVGSGRGTQSNEFGVHVNTGGLVSSTSGDIAISGLSAATGGGSTNRGVRIAGAIETLGSGNITIEGTGAATTGGFTNGVAIIDGGQVRSNGASSTGRISITGTTAGAGASDGGVLLQNGGFISSRSGDITVRGTTTSGGADTRGVFVDNGANLDTRIESLGAASIAITGNSGDPASASRGIRMRNSTIGGADMTGDILLNSLSGTGMDLDTGTIRTSGNVTLNASGGGNVTQGTSSILAGGLRLLSDGPGSFMLNGAGNNIASIAGNVVGTISYTDANTFNVGALTTDEDASGATAATASTGLTTGSDATLTALNGGTISVSAGNPITAGGAVTLTADAVDLAGQVSAPGQIVTIRPQSAGRPIDLGTETGGRLSLTDAELDGITAGTLRIGARSGVFGSSIDAGEVTISQALTLDPTRVTELQLLSGSGVWTNGGASLSVNGLAVTAVDGVVLDGANNSVNTVALESTAGHVSFRNSMAFTVGTVGSIAGASGGEVLISAPGTITIDNPISSVIGYIVKAEGAASDVVVNAPITSTLFNTGSFVETLQAGRDVIINASGRVHSIDALSIAADRFVTIADRALATDRAVEVGASPRGFPSIVIRGDQGVSVTAIETAAASADTVTITSANGAITDGGDTARDLIAPNGRAVLSAATGIGSANALETSLARLSATNLASGNVSVVNSSALSVSGSNVGGGSFDVTARGRLTVHADNIDANTGRVTLRADEMTLTGTVAGGNVGLRPDTAGTEITLAGGTDGLDLTNADLARVTTAGVLIVGADDAGSITIAGGVSAPATWDTLSLRTGAAIVDANSTGADVTVTSLALRSVSGIGAAGNPLETAVTNLAFENTGAGGVAIANTGALNLIGVDGISVLNGGSGGLSISASSPFTQSVDFIQDGSITLTAGESAANDDHLTIASNVTVRSNLGDVTLNAGDDVIVSTGALVESGAVGGTVRLNAGVANVDVTGGAITGAGTVSGANVLLDAFSGVGSAGARFNTAAGTLAARTTSSGGVFVSESGAVTLANVSGIANATAANGAYDVTAVGPIAIGGNISTGSGNVTLASTTGDIAGGAGRISSSGGVTLSGGIIGDATNPVLLDLGTTGTVSAASTTLGGTIVLSDSAAGGLQTSRVTLATPGASTEDVVIAQTGAGGITVNENIGNARDNIALVASPGKITQGAGTVTGLAVGLSGAMGVGTDTANRVLTNAQVLAASSSGSAGVFVSELDAVALSIVGAITNTTGSGVYDLLAGGAVAINEPLTTTGGAVVINAPAITSLAAGIITTTAPSDGGLASGSVTLNATAGSIDLAGAVVTAGADGATTFGGQGGNVVLSATGAISVAEINARGGDTASGADNGGNAGVMSFTTGVGQSVTLTGDLNARGGDAVGGGNIGGSGSAVSFNQAVLVGNDIFVDASGGLGDTAGAGGNLTFGSTVDSTSGNFFNLTTISNAITRFDGVVGGTDPLFKLTTTGGGTTEINATSITTVGGQEYKNPVSLVSNTALTDSGAMDIVFDQTVESATAADPRSLTMSTDGFMIFQGAVGGNSRPLLSLTVNDAGGGFALTGIGGGAITTTTTQTYSTPVEIAADTVFTSTGAGADGNITFASTLDTASFAFSPVSATISTAGTTTFGDFVGALNVNFDPLASLTVSGGGTTVFAPSAFGAPFNVVVTDGSQSYGGPVRLETDVTLMAGCGCAVGDISFASTINSDGALTPRLLSVATAGTATFSGSIGNDQPLSALVVGAPTIVFDGAAAQTVTVAGTTGVPAIYFSGVLGPGDPTAVRLAQNVTLTAGAGDIYIDGTIDGTATSVPVVISGALTTSSSGATQFNGAIGATTRLVSLTTSAAGGASLFTGSVVNTVDSQSYGDSVTLGANMIFSSNGNGDITFSGTIESPITPFTLDVNTAARATFSGNIGGNGNPLASLATDGPGSTVLGGTTSIAVDTVGAQTYRDTVSLAQNATLTNTTVSNITFEGSVNSPGTARALTVNSQGQVSFGGSVGGAPGDFTAPLASLTTDAGGLATVITGGTVTTSGAQSYGEAVTLGGPATLTSTGGGTIGFSSTIDGANPLTVDARGGTFSVVGAIGGGTPLTALDATADTISIAAVAAAGPVLLTTDNIAFSSISAPGEMVTIQTRTAGREIAIASDPGGLQLSASEVNSITADTLRIGRNDGTASGAITIFNDIAPTVATLHLRTGAGVTGAAGGVVLPSGTLVIDAGAAVSMTDASTNVLTLAGTVSGGASFTLMNEADGFMVGAADGVSGLAATGGDGSITLGSGGSITVGENVSAAGTGAIVVNSTNPFGAVNVSADRSIASASGSIVIRANNVLLDTTTPGNRISTTGTVQLTAETLAREINVGSDIDKGALGLSDAALDRIAAGVIQIGDAAHTGAIRIVADINPANAANALLINNTGGIAVGGGFTVTGNLALTANGGGAVDGAITHTAGTLGANELDLTAATGIGTGAAPILTSANTLGASNSTSGGIFVTNDKSVALGGAGVGDVSIAAGDGSIVVSAAGSITLAQGVSTSTAGAVTLNANGGAISTTGGVVTGGTVSLNASTGIGAAGAINTVADTLSAVNAASGDVIVVDLNGISVSGSNTGGGAFNITAGGVGSTLTVNAGNVDANAGSVTLRGDELALTGTVTGNGGVTLRPNTAGTEVRLGSGGAGINLSDAELDLVTTSGVLTVGADDAGSITISARIDAPATWGTLSLRTGGAIVDANAVAGADIQATSLAMRSATGIGAPANPLETQVGNLAFVNTGAGGVSLFNSGALNIAGVDGIAMSSQGSGALNLAVGSPLTIAMDLIGAGDATFGADESGALTDDLTVSAGFTVQSTAGNVTLNAGDDVVIAGTVRAAGSLTVTSGVADVDGLGGIGGAGLAAGTTVTLDSLTGVGSSLTRVNTEAVNLVARSRTSGGVFVSEADALVLNSLDNVAAGGGAYDITAGGTITLSAAVNTAGSGPTTLTAAGGGSIVLGADAGNASAATTLTSAGTITGTGLVRGTAVILDGVGGVGAAGARINTAAGSLAARATGAGSVNVSELDGVTLESLGGVANGTSGAAYDVLAGGTIAVSGPVASAGGAIALEGTAISSTAAGVITSTGGNAGNVSLKATAGAIDLAGAIVAAAGPSFGDEPGRSGGNVSLEATAASAISATDTRGGDSFAASGGPAGMITFMGPGVTLRGNLTAKGGDGGGKDGGNGGNVTLNGNVLLAADVTIDARGGVPGPAASGDIIFGGALDSAAGTNRSLAANTAGITRFTGAIGATDRLSALTTDAGGTTEINGGSVATTDAQVYGDAVSIGGAAGTPVASTGGSVTFGSTLAAGDHPLTLTADEIDFNGLANSVSGTGTILLQPLTDGVSIGIGGGAGTLDISLADVAALTNGFNAITIGRAAGSGTTTVNAVTFNDPVTIRQPAAGGAIVVNGTITGADNASVTLTSPGIILNAGITTADQDITLGSVAVGEGSSVTLSTGAGGGGNILVTGPANGTTGGAAESLTVIAGTGNVTFTGNVGNATNATELEALTIGSAATTLFSGTVNLAGAFTQTAGSVATTFDGAVSVGSAALTGTAFNVNNSFTTTGALGVTNSGTFTKGATGTIAAAGGFSASGNVSLANSITTSDTDLTIGGTLVIAEGAAPTLSTSPAGGGNIVVTGTTNGTAGGAAESLTVLAGTGNVTFTGNVGNSANGTELEALTIGSAATALFSGTVDLAGALTQGAGSIATTFDGVVNAGSASLTGTAFNVNESFTTTGAMAVANSGTFTKGATGAITAPGGFSTTGAAVLANNVTTTNTPLTIGGALTLTENADITLSTQGAAGAGAITIGGATNGTAGVGDEALTLNAGTGTVSVGGLSGAAGAASASGLTAVTVTNAGTTNFNGPIAITGALTQTNAATGVTTFAGTVSAGSATLRGTAFNVNDSFTTTGALAVTNSGTFTRGPTGTIAAGGGFNTSGNVVLANDITTTDTDLTIGGTLVIAQGAAPTLSTGAAGGGNIVVTGTTNGTTGGAAESMTVLAGTGNVTFTGNVGNAANTTELEALTIGSAATTLFSGTVNLAGALTQAAGSVATTFNGAVTAGSASLIGTAFNVTNSFTTTTGALAVTNSGTFTKGATGAIAAAGGFSTSGNVALASDVTTTDTDLTVGGNLTIAEGAALTLSTGAAGGGNIVVTGTTNGTTGGAAESLTVLAGSGNVTFTGNVGNAANASELEAVTVGSAATALFSGTVDLAGALTQSAGTVATTFNGVVNAGSAALAGTAFNVNESFTTTGAMTVTNSGTFTKGPTGTIAAPGGFSASGNVSLANNITTGDTDLTIAGTLVIAEGAAPTLSTGAGGGNIVMTGTTNGTTGGVAESLTVLAGTGNVTFTTNVGNGANSTELEALTIGSAATALFSGTVNLAGALTQSAGSVATTFDGPVSVGSASLTGTAFNVNDTFTTTTGTLAVTNSGTFAKGATGAIAAAGGFSTSGNVSLANNITTSDTDLTIGGTLVIAEGAAPTLSTGAAGGGNIVVTGTTNGTTGGAAETLTVLAGTGNVIFTGNVGNAANATELEALIIDSAATALFSGAVNLAAALTQGAGSIATTFEGPVSVGSASLTGTAFNVNSSFTTTTGALAVTNSGTFSKGATGGIAAAGGFSASGNVALANNITTGDTDLTIGGNLMIAQGAAPTLSTSAAGGGNIVVTGTTNGSMEGAAESLTALAGTGNVTFTGNVGNAANSTELEALTIGSAATTLFNGTVNLAGALTQGAGSVATTFEGPVSVGSAALAGTAFNVNNSFASAGTTAFINSGVLTKTATGDITSTGAFSTTGDVNLASNIATTNSNLTIGGNLVIAAGAAPTLSAGVGDITIAGAVNGGTSLTANSTGATTFTGAIGGTSALGSLTTDAGGTTAINGGAVSTTGNQTFNDAVTLGAVTVINAGAGTIDFKSTLGAGANALTLTANGIDFNGGAGSVTGASTILLQPVADGVSIGVGGGVGTLQLSTIDVAALGNGFSGITIGRATGTGTTTVNAVTFGDPVLIRQPGAGGSIAVEGAITGAGNASVTLIAGSGGIALNNDITTTSSSIALNGAVTLGGASRTLTAGAGDITLGATVDGGSALAVNSTGATTFSGAVGGTTPLASLTTNAGGSTAINGGTVMTTGSQTYGDAVTIGANTVLTSSAADVTFSSTLDADLAANNRTISVNAPVGTVTFSGNVGVGQALADLDVTAGPNTIVFNGAAAQIVNVTAGAGNTVSFNGPVLLVQDVTLNTGGAANNGVLFGGAVNASAASARTFVVDAGTGAVLYELVGNVAPLAALTTTGGLVTFNANAIAGQMTITANEILTGLASGMITATLPFAGFSGPVALTLRGNTGVGMFGTEADALRVDVPGHLVVSPNTDRSMPIVWLRGEPAKKPFYEFYDSSDRRLVYYNGPPVPSSLVPGGEGSDPLRQEIQRFASELTESTQIASAAATNLTAEVERELARPPEPCTATSLDSASALLCQGPQTR